MNPQNIFLPWACPVCHQILSRTEKNWYCSNNHNFDIAKSGYANLLLAHQKASKQPGDSVAMLKARREFLDSGHFQPIASAVSNCINEYSSHSTFEPRTLLDIGCGEGYYLRQLKSLLLGNWSMAGLDIAKDGVQMAAKSDCQTTWVCASNNRLPLINRSLDVLLRIFAPSDILEASRVLKDDGLLVTVTPATHHLHEIKRALYEKVREHHKSAQPEGLRILSEEEITYELSLNQPHDIQSLLGMTPFFWRGRAEGREMLLKQKQLEVKISVWISCYRKIDN